MSEARDRLTRIFARINHADLPALSAHVQEIISMVDSRTATAEALSEIVLKDFSLTNKIFQIVNSPYYCRTVPIGSISRAVATLGFHSIRDLAIAVGVFEEFLKAGLEKEGISMLLAKSFVSAELARLVCLGKKLPLSAEEVFVCSLLRHLGRIVILVYFPDLYRRIEARMAAGELERDAAGAVLDGLSFEEVGREIALFWNFPGNVIATMTEKPRKPRDRNDTEAWLQVLVIFSNRLVDSLCGGGDISPLIATYGRLLGLRLEEIVDFALASVEKVGDMSPVSRYGLIRLKLRSKLLFMERNLPRPSGYQPSVA
ncbi:MAG: HDOD domain-containing protein [Desulfobacteraceae bacterium]|nr:HDOD domain-containing protein [Desulfobacteraceae bacterium]